MENDDLLKITDESKKRDFKKILVYGAIAFLVFVIGVVSFAIYKNSTSNEAILPPEVEKKEPIFKQIPVEKKVVEDTIEDLNENNQNNNIETKPQVETKQQAREVKKEKKEIKKPKIVNVETKPIKEDIKKENIVKPKRKVSGRYYIQVAALLKWKKPNKKFLETIKKDGFNYKILETYTTINGKKVKVTKVLIGPFSSKKEARRSLTKIRKFISKSAFIIKVR